MAVRIQFRRGTAAEWTSANPTLAPGELGYETDTAKFKLGDGSTAWASLDYAGINQDDIDSAVANVIDLAPGTLDTLNELAASIGDDEDFAGTVANSIALAEANAQSYANTVSTNAQSAAQSYADNAIANLIDSSPSALDTLNELAAALGDDANFSTTVTNSLANKISFVADTNANIANNTSTSVADTFYFAADSKSIWIGDGVTSVNELNHVAYESITWAIDEHNNVTTNVHGISDTSDLVYQSDLSDHITETSNVHGISNTLDLLVTSDLTAHASETTNVHGISDTSDLVVTADLDDYALLSGPTFTGTVTLPSDTSIGGVTSTELNYLTNVTSDIQDQLDLKAPLENPTFSNTVVLPAATSIGDVDSTEIARLANVSSNIQDQLDTKLASADAANTYAPIASPTFTGNVVLPATTVVGDISATELGYITNVTSDVQDQLDAKLDSTTASSTYAPINDAALTGTVTLPTNTSIGNVTATEISYLENISGDVQTQINAKLASATAATIYAPLANATLTGTVSLPATTSIGDVSATEIGYLDGVTSSVQTQLNAKAPTESPTFTGTVSGVTASMVGLSNVDNTSDLDKPISNATQTALNAKLSLAGGTMTGKIVLDGDPTQALHPATKQYVDSAEAGLAVKAQVEAATTGNLSATYDNGTAGVGATLNLGQLATLDIDGVTSWELLDGILVKDQTNDFENGRYVVDQIGNDTDTDWIIRRCSLCDTADEIPGAYIFVIDGTANNQTGWVLHVADPDTFTVGTDDISVYQFAGAGAITGGTNIDVNGSQVSVVSNPTFANVVTVSSGVKFADNTIQTSAGVPSLTGFVEKTASYTLDTLDHQDNVVEMNSGSAVTFTIPTNAALAWPVGASMDIIQTGAGQVTISPDSGVTLNYTPGNKLRTTWSSCTIMKRGTDSWILYGDLTA